MLLSLVPAKVSLGAWRGAGRERDPARAWQGSALKPEWDRGVGVCVCAV